MQVNDEFYFRTSEYIQILHSLCLHVFQLYPWLSLPLNKNYFHYFWNKFYKLTFASPGMNISQRIQSQVLEWTERPHTNYSWLLLTLNSYTLGSATQLPNNKWLEMLFLPMSFFQLSQDLHKNTDPLWNTKILWLNFCIHFFFKNFI